MCLAAFPAVQEAVAAELAAAGFAPGSQNDEQLSYDALLKLPYLAAVVQEVARMFPVSALGELTPALYSHARIRL